MLQNLVTKYFTLLTKWIFHDFLLKMPLPYFVEISRELIGGFTQEFSLFLTTGDRKRCDLVGFTPEGHGFK